MYTLNTDSGSIVTKPLKPHFTCIGVFPIAQFIAPRKKLQRTYKNASTMT